MFVDKGGKLAGLDNRAVGSVAGAENLVAGVAAGSRPAPRFLDASNSVAGASVSSITLSGNTATLTTGSSHGLVPGDVIQISGCVEDQYNGDKYLITASGTTMTFEVYGSPSSPATGSPAYRVHP